MKPQRAKGVVTYRSPKNEFIDAANKLQKQRREETQARAARRAAAPVPNWICYQGSVFIVGKNIDEKGNWLGGRLPRCRVCEGRLDPQENHVCPGFTPKYVEHDDEWHECTEDRRQGIREARLEDMRESRNSHYCDDCGEELLNEEHAIEHAEDCRRTVECPDCGEELEFMVEHECSVRQCRRCGESLYWGTEHTCEP